MKPTLDSIKAAHRAATDINTNSLFALVALAQAGTAFKCSSPGASVERLKEARAQLSQLRRTQTAALENIDAALDSMKL